MNLENSLAFVHIVSHSETGGAESPNLLRLPPHI